MKSNLTTKTGYPSITLECFWILDVATSPIPLPGRGWILHGAWEGPGEGGRDGGKDASERVGRRTEARWGVVMRDRPWEERNCWEVNMQSGDGSASSSSSSSSSREEEEEEEDWRGGEHKGGWDQGFWEEGRGQMRWSRGRRVGKGEEGL